MEQKTHTGLDSLQQLPLLLKELKVRRIFLVTGNKSFEVCGAKEILYVILKDYHIHRFSDFTPNPKIEDIQKGIEEFEINKSDIILAVGGGSVMDVAKSIALLSRQEKPEQGPLYVKGEKPLTQDPLRVIAIPTTAGSGSEATHFAVVYVEGKKYSLAHKLLRPAHVFLVPEFGLSLDKKTAASAAMDALCQAIESYWSIGATEESKGYSAKAIRLLLNNLPPGIIQEDLQWRGPIYQEGLLILPKQQELTLFLIFLPVIIIFHTVRRWHLVYRVLLFLIAH
jgi:alcohol dehydrogenase class IV